jgi:hypothetical protein
VVERALVALLTAPVFAVSPPAAAQAPEVALAFSARSLLGGQSFTVGGTLPGGAGAAGRAVQLYERRAPFPGSYALAQTVTAGAGGEFSFAVTPVRKAYGPGAVATLQRRNRTGGFADLKVVLLRSAGAYSSYRLRTRIRRSGVYRVVVPTSTHFSRGASVGITLRMRRPR